MIYIMLGALLAAWGGLWLFSEIALQAPSRGVYFVCAGLLASGISLVAIGLRMGQIAGRAPSAQDRISQPGTTPLVDKGRPIGPKT